MKIKVPKSVNVGDLLCKLDLTPTRRLNLLNKIHYFLSLHVITNKNYKLFEETGGYRRISSIKMKKMMSRKDYYLILSLLKDPADPIIISNRSWRSSKNGTQRGFSMGYRLTPKYNTGEIKLVTIPDKVYERYLKCLDDGEFDDSKYHFLYGQFTGHTLSLDESVDDYIRSFGQSLISRASNEYQLKMVYNLIGRWRYWVDNIQKKKYWYSVSPSNHRLNSSITHLKHELRDFLLCDGRQLSMIDFRASQPYVLAAVLRNEFFYSSSGGFNLFSIYPEVYNKLVPVISNTGTSNRSFEYFSFSGSSHNYDLGPVSGTSSGVFQSSYSFMWGKFPEQDIRSILKYQSVPYEDDFYRYVISQYRNCDYKDISDRERQEFKDQMMLVLFLDNQKKRNNIKYIKVFKEIFPGVDEVITSLHKKIGNDKLSYLLQRAESYLVLDTVSREFSERFPEAPLFTIHDALITFPEYTQNLQELILGRFYEITGLKVGLKQSCLKPVREPKKEDIDEQWGKIKAVRTIEDYNEKNYHVFPENIRRGMDFLSK